MGSSIPDNVLISDEVGPLCGDYGSLQLPIVPGPVLTQSRNTNLNCLPNRPGFRDLPISGRAPRHEHLPFPDRQALERLFQVRDRRARVVVSRFEGMQIGHAWLTWSQSVN